jgi:hypothetical protein
MLGLYLTQLLYALATLCFMGRGPGVEALVQGFIVGLCSVFVVALLEHAFSSKMRFSKNFSKGTHGETADGKLKETHSGTSEQDLEERILSR